MLDAVLRSVDEESITVVKDGRVLSVSLGEIEQCRVIRGGLITRGAVVGASTGFAIGGLIGFLGAPREDRGLRTGTTALAAGIVGGIIGSVIESVPDKDEILNLREKTIAEKKEILVEILKQPAE
jgi:outer membrane lipoprotein SlyB